MINFFNTKSKIIALITTGVVVAGGVAFAFRDQFLSDKNLYLKIEKENIEMIVDKIDEIKKEDLLGLFFAEDSNKSITKTDVSLNISAENKFAKNVADFFNSIKLSITDEIIQKQMYQNKRIALSHNQEELIDLSIVNDEKTVAISVPKLYDKWIISDMSLAEFIAEIIKSDEGTGTTNTVGISDIQSIFTFSKTEKQDFINAFQYHLDKLEKTLNDVIFTKVEDDTFSYNDNQILCKSIRLDLSEIETLARLSQMLIKLKENGQLIDLIYDKVQDIKVTHGEKNIITDNIPEKKVVLDRINELLDKIDERLLELNIEDSSILFDEEDNFVGAEGMEDNYYSMIIYFDNDYEILKRAIYTPEYKTEAIYEFVSVDSGNEAFYMFKRPDEIIEDKVIVNDKVSMHNFSKSYYKETISFQGLKLNKVEKWIDDEKFLTIEIDSSNNGQKIISFEMPSIKLFKLFVDINRQEQGRNELNVVTKLGIDVKGEKQYATINKQITRKADINKIDIESNSINLNEETQKKINMITDVVKGNTDSLSKSIEEKTGIDFSETLKIVKDVPQKAIDTYKTLNSLGIIGN